MAGEVSKNNEVLGGNPDTRGVEKDPVVIDDIADTFVKFDNFLSEQGVPQEGVVAIKEVIGKSEEIPGLYVTLSGEGYNSKFIFDLIEPRLMRQYAEYKEINGGSLSKYWVNKIFEDKTWISSLYYYFVKNCGESGLNIESIGLDADTIKYILNQIRGAFTNTLSNFDSIDNMPFDSLSDSIRKRDYYASCIGKIDEMLSELGDQQSSDAAEDLSELGVAEKSIFDKLSSYDRVCTKVDEKEEYEIGCDDPFSSIDNAIDNCWTAYHTFDADGKSENKEKLKSTYSEFYELWSSFKIAGFVDGLFNNELSEKGKERKNYVESVNELLKSLKDKIDNLGNKDEDDEVRRLLNKLNMKINRLSDDYGKAGRKLDDYMDTLSSKIKREIFDHEGFSKDLFFRLYEYEEFLPSLIRGIYRFNLDRQDYKKFLDTLFNGNYDGKDVFIELLGRVDDHKFLEDLDFIRLYLSLYPERKSENSELEPAKFVNECTNNQIKSMKDEEFEVFINLIKTTQYWTEDVSKRCYDECVSRSMWNFILDNYAMGYFLSVTSGEQLYNELSSDKGLCSEENEENEENGYLKYIENYLPLFSYELVKNVIGNLKFSGELYMMKECYRMLLNRKVLKKGDERGKIRL